MAKNKVKKQAETNDYFYEVLGVTIIVLSLVTLGELGRFGIILNILIKILLGDFSFLVLLLLLFVGIRSLIKKKLIDVRTLQFQGFVLVYLAFALLTHLAIYNYLGLSSNEILSTSFKLYKNYFKAYDSSYIFGGGLVGALLFQVISFLLGEVGIFIIAFTFLLLGASFLMNTKLIDMIINGKRFTKIIKKVFFGIKSYFKGLKYKEKSKEKKLEKPEVFITLSNLKDVMNNENNIQGEINKEVFEHLEIYIKQNNMFARLDRYISSYCYSRYVLECINSNSYKTIREKINVFFDNKCFYIRDKSYVYVDVLNTFKDLLSLKRLLTIDNKIQLSIGLDVSNELINIDFINDLSLFLCGEYNSGIKTSVRSFIVNALLLHKDEVMFEVLDSKREFEELDNLSRLFNYYITEIEGIEMLSNLSLEYERRKEILNYLDVDNYIDANKDIKISYPNIKLIKPMYVIINCNLLRTTLDFYNKLNYLLKFSYKVGIFFIVIIRKKEELSKVNTTNNVMVGFYTSELELSLRVTNSDLLCCLNKKGDFIYVKQDVIRHGQAPFISTSDYQNALKKTI